MINFLKHLYLHLSWNGSIMNDPKYGSGVTTLSCGKCDKLLWSKKLD